MHKAKFAVLMILFPAHAFFKIHFFYYFWGQNSTFCDALATLSPKSQAVNVLEWKALRGGV